MKFESHSIAMAGPSGHGLCLKGIRHLVIGSVIIKKAQHHKTRENLTIW
jgi:hypothetical protein